MKTHHVICSCSSPDHVVQFVSDPEDPDEVLYIQVQLHQYRSWYQRIQTALKYILGYQCRYGHWDCTSLDKTEAGKLFRFLRDHSITGKDAWREDRLKALYELEASHEEY